MEDVNGPLATQVQRFIKRQIEEAIPNCKVKDVFVGTRTVKARVQLFRNNGKMYTEFVAEAPDHQNIIKAIKKIQADIGCQKGRCR